MWARLGINSSHLSTVEPQSLLNMRWNSVPSRKIICLHLINKVAPSIHHMHNAFVDHSWTRNIDQRLFKLIISLTLCVQSSRFLYKSPPNGDLGLLKKHRLYFSRRLLSYSSSYLLGMITPLPCFPQPLSFIVADCTDLSYQIYLVCCNVWFISLPLTQKGK